MSGMEIDWGQAPDEATHALSTGPKWDGSQDLIGKIRFAVKRGKGYAESSDPDGVEFCMGKKSWVVVAERPAAWTGEGLPPVGTVCEMQHEDWNRGWEKVLVLYASNAYVITSDPKSGEQHWYPRNLSFRPLRTPDQIAAEEREKAVSEMADTLRIQLGTNYRDDLARLYCFILHDAGYRKTETAK